MASETSDSRARAEAVASFQIGNYKLAVRLLPPVLARHPADVLLLRLHGMALVRAGAAADGVPYLAQAARLAPGDALSATWHGIGLHSAGHHAEAARALQTASALAPGDPAPLIHLSRALLTLGQPQEALAAARRAVSLAPRLLDAERAARLSELAVLQATATTTPAALAEAWLALGRICMRLDKVMDARAAFTEALGLQRLHPEAACELALVEHLCGQPMAATARLQVLLDREPGCLTGRLALASRLLLEDGAAAALALLDAATPADGALRAHWHAQRTQALIGLGRDEAASRELALAERHRLPELELLLTWQRFVLARRLGRPEAAVFADRVTRLATIREAGTLEQRIDAHFDLADLARLEHRHAAAFEYVQRGHALLRAAQPFSRLEHEQHLGAIMRSFDANRLANGARSTAGDPAPVFIVGLPRTGTTLLEQILSAHPMVHGAGERLAIRETLVRLTGTTGAVTATTRAASLDAAALTAASADYLAELHALAPDAARVLDKMPDNVFQLGFIATLLPGARIVCCTRDLRDVGASIFQHRFIGHHPYAHDLADLGWYMAAQQRLLTHWQSSLPSPILMLDHADWIGDFDATLRRVLAFLDLPYDAACERFFEQDRRIGSASRAQVRRPINADGVGRWRLWAEQLAPMLHELPR
ncbi:tetratricopeptide repeat-containing sulfotransferase family protein [Lichenicola sp.]|uniref:tetratricopeptide repeat-containing sulfotransferase family protein n=1 Tax=Lichenicola sp. TaxID=2804529 RepID=UPI003B00B559